MGHRHQVQPGVHPPRADAADAAGADRQQWLLALSARTLPIGTAYAVWVGIGALGTAVMGALLFGEPVSLARGVCLVMLLVSILGLKVTAS